MRTQDVVYYMGGIKTAETSISVPDSPYWFGVSDKRDNNGRAHVVPAVLGGMGLAAAAAAMPSAIYRGVTGRSMPGTAATAIANIVKARPISHGMPTVAGRAAELNMPVENLQDIADKLKGSGAGIAASIAANSPMGVVKHTIKGVNHVSDFAHNNPEAMRGIALSGAVGAGIGAAAGAALQGASNYSRYQLGEASTHEDDSLYARLKRALK